MLSANGRFDANGDDITYLWTAPNGITLSDNTNPEPSFTITQGTKASTEYEFTLTVTESQNAGASSIDTVKVTVLNTPPSIQIPGDKIMSLGIVLR